MPALPEHRRAQMDLHALTLAGLTLGLVACVSPSLPPVAAHGDPAVHEIYLIAFANDGPGYILLERLDRATTEINAYDPATRTRTPVSSPGSFTVPSPWPDRTELARSLAASPALKQATADLGYGFADLLDGPPPILFDAQVTLDEDIVIVRASDDDDARADLLQLPSDAIESHRWLLSSDRRHLGLEVQYAKDAGPQVRALYVFDTGKRVGAFWSAEGYAAHQERDYTTAKRLWLRALAADRSAADVLYNLACADALLGAPDTAMSFLETAITLEPAQLREYARDDPDLVSLQQRADFRALIWEQPAWQPGHSPD